MPAKLSYIEIPFGPSPPVNVNLGIGYIPGFGFLFTTNQVTLNTPLFPEKSGISVGLSDLNPTTGQAYNGSEWAETGLFGDGPFDAGESNFGGSDALGLPEDFTADLIPGCFDATYVLESGFLPQNAAILTLGNTCQSFVGTFNPVTSPGNQSITGVGFQPDIVIFIGGPPSEGTSQHGTDGMLGVMDASGNQWVSHARSSYFSETPAERESVFFNDACVAHIGLAQAGAETTHDTLANFVSMDSDGFTIDVTITGSSGSHPLQFGFLAIKVLSGGGVEAGIATQGDTSISVSFQPDGMVFGSAQLPTSGKVSGSFPTQSYQLIGATDGVTQMCAQGGTKTETASPLPKAVNYFSNESAIIMYDRTPTKLAEGQVTLTSGGCDIDWLTDNGANNLIGWIAFAIDREAPTVPIAITTAPSDVEATLAFFNGTVIPNTTPGDDVGYYFQWGETISYGHTTTLSTDGSGTTPEAVSAFVNTLSPATIYHYRLVIHISDTCQFFGNDITFATPPGEGAVIFRNRWRAQVAGELDTDIPVFIGFTAASGLGNAEHDLLDWDYNEGGGAHFSYPDFSSVVGLNINGDSAQSGSLLALIPPGPAIGSVWREIKVSPFPGFSSEFTFNINTPGENGPGDGFAFVLQGQANDYVDSSGGQTMGLSEISPFFAVVFNDWQHEWDPSADGVAVFASPAAWDGGNPPPIIWQQDLTGLVTISDGSNHDVALDYTPGTLTITIDSLDPFTVPIDIAAILAPGFPSDALAVFNNEFRVIEPS